MSMKPKQGESVHWCPVIDEKKIKDILVTTYDGEWIVRGEFEDTAITDVSFCPFCGEKLVPVVVIAG